ncbi:MAG: uracil phosphoribosyltransferase [Bacteroidaceae bacterium]|nr:uracil phosphoribosyltransferase [Bacteroidaceae bacterium]MBO4590627.1 uracil phosphoribosyltransferase [Bacteroidaceae bacterium]MBR5963488.1 uracil phosphoribosyltransferase [Bacteroidaceae bacterium]
MKVINLSDTYSVLGRFLADLRDVNIQKDPLRFRRNLERIGEIEAYEISKTLSYQTVKVQTPLGKAPTHLSPDKIVLGTIFRAGLPLHQGFLNVFDRAENAFVSAYRYYKDEECKDVGIKIEYIASPVLNDKVLIIADPMLATGGSMELACEAFHSKGQARHTHLACVIAARPGVEYLEKLFKGRDDVTLWCGAIDKQLNEHSYIVPGLGDAGDLAYGEKTAISYQW